MTERERLIEIFKKINYRPYPNTIEANLTTQFSDYALEHIVDEFFENGVIVPPVTLGQTVYTIQGQRKYPKEWKVVGIWKSEECCNFHAVCYVDGKFEASSSFEDWMIGKTVFLTKEEAEQALRKEDEGK